MSIDVCPQHGSYVGTNCTYCDWPPLDSPMATDQPEYGCTCHWKAISPKDRCLVHKPKIDQPDGCRAEFEEWYREYFGSEPLVESDDDYLWLGWKSKPPKREVAQPDDCRRAFEAWHKPSKEKAKLDHSGRYIDDWTQALWTGFSANWKPKREIVEVKGLGDWHEDDGNVLWWNFPIDEPPYAGTPLDDSFPEYKTHWTRFETPRNDIEDGETNG